MRRTLLLLSAVIFALSFLMPAYAGDGAPVTGFGCAKICAHAFSNPNIRALPAKLYYFGFVVTNILFVALLIHGFVVGVSGWILRALSVLLLAHVVSWLLLNCGERMEHSTFPIYSGYFVWLTAFAILAVSAFIPHRRDPYEKA